jgi:hypothetical protein
MLTRVLNLFSRPKPGRELRAAGGFTSEFIAARSSYITGRSGLGELTACVQTCVSLWENSISIAAVKGTEFLRPRVLAQIGRALARRGEALFVIREDRLIPCSDWDVATRDGVPRAYRVTIPESSGGRTETLLAGEVLHFITGAELTSPWAGTSPLQRAQLTAGLLHVLESALAEIYESAPLGSQVVPMPENPEVSNEQLARGFRGRRGSVLLRESVVVTAAGGPVPQADWRPNGLTPDLSGSLINESHASARDAILSAFGVLPAWLNPMTTGPLVREAQRHLAQFVLQPIAEVIAQECSEKLSAEVTLDLITPLQAYDQSGRARAFATIVEGLAAAKNSSLPAESINAALAFIDET